MSKYNCECGTLHKKQAIKISEYEDLRLKITTDRDITRIILKTCPNGIEDYEVVIAENETCYVLLEKR